MCRYISTILCLTALPAMTVMAQNYADYPVVVHVISSASVIVGSGTNTLSLQVLETIIDGQPVQLAQIPVGSFGVLALGDYHARISPKIHPPKGGNAYDTYKA